MLASKPQTLNPQTLNPEPQVSCALVMEINNFLANQFRNVLASKLSGGPARLLAAMAPGPEAAGEHGECGVCGGGRGGGRRA